MFRGVLRADPQQSLLYCYFFYSIVMLRCLYLWSAPSNIRSPLTGSHTFLFFRFGMAVLCYFDLVFQVSFLQLISSSDVLSMWHFFAFFFFLYFFAALLESCQVELLAWLFINQHHSWKNVNISSLFVTHIGDLPLTTLMLWVSGDLGFESSDDLGSVAGGC